MFYQVFFLLIFLHIFNQALVYKGLGYMYVVVNKLICKKDYRVMKVDLHSRKNVLTIKQNLTLFGVFIVVFFVSLPYFQFFLFSVVF